MDGFTKNLLENDEYRSNNRDGSLFNDYIGRLYRFSDKSAFNGQEKGRKIDFTNSYIYKRGIR